MLKVYFLGGSKIYYVTGPILIRIYHDFLLNIIRENVKDLLIYDSCNLEAYFCNSKGMNESSEAGN